MIAERYTQDELLGVAEESQIMLKNSGTPQDAIDFLLANWLRSHVEQGHVTAFTADSLWMDMKHNGFVVDQEKDWVR